MEDSTELGQAVKTVEPLPELRPSQVGWIFRDGACLAIERQVDEDPAPVLAD